MTGGDWLNDIHVGDARDLPLPDSSIHCVMTSPPYFGQRDYGVDGQIGLEESLGDFVDELVEVGEEIRRVLRPDGNWWLNLGDSFAGSWGAQSKSDEANHRDRDAYPGKNPARNGTLRRKSKMLSPHRVAIALQDAGWVVRSDAVWSKPNPMPHSVKDRLHEHKEFVFHLTPEPMYWFDLDAVRESTDTQLDPEEYEKHLGESFHDHSNDEEQRMSQGSKASVTHPNGKNPGDILEVTVKQFPEAHFAVYPPELCELPIKSSCPPVVCAGCGRPYERVNEAGDIRSNPNDRRQKAEAVRLADEHDLTDEHLEAVRRVGFHDDGISNHEHDGGFEKVDRETAELAREVQEALGSYAREFWTVPRESAGWTQACDCETDETEAGIVLDPFAGAGTTCLVAKRLRRRFVGIDLNPDYVALAQRRAGLTVDEPERLDGVESSPLSAYTDGGGPGE